MMLTGELIFRAPVSGDRLLTFPTLEVKPVHPSVARIEVTAPKTNDSRACTIQVTVRFSSVTSKDEASLIGWQIAKDILDRVAFDQNISIEEPPAPAGHFVQVALDGGKVGPMQAFDGATCFMRGHVVMEPDVPDLARLGKKLNARRLKGRTYYPLFRTALRAENPVEKYLALYRILLVIHDDKQQDVDGFLHDEFGDKLTPRPGQKTKPGKPKIKETVFTRLRNEFAHIRKRTRLKSTREQMEQHMERLIERVKRAVEKNG
jgi:hypothetical protein